MGAVVQIEQPSIAIDILETRWDAAMVAPWRPGERTKLWVKLYTALRKATVRVAMVDDTDLDLPAYSRIVDGLMDELGDKIVAELHRQGLARTGYEGIGPKEEGR